MSRTTTTTTSRSTSRGKNEYNVFNPNLKPEMYKRENLERFVLTAGVEELNKYKAALDAEKDRLQTAYLKQAGVNMNDKMAVAAAHQFVGKTGPYKRALQQLRYDIVKRLFMEGRIGPVNEISQTQAAGAGLVKEITKADITNKLRELGTEGFILWIQQQEPVGFKANALEEAARQLGVKGYSTIKGVGIQRKNSLFNLIMNQTGGVSIGSTSGIAGVRTTTIQPVSGLTAELAQRPRPITSAGGLTALKSDELKALAKKYDIPASGKKSDYVNAIAAAAAFGVMRSSGEVETDVDSLIELAKTNPEEAYQRAKMLNPDELGQVPLTKMRQFASALGLRGRGLFPPGTSAPSRDLIIRVLTGERTARSRSRENRENIITNPSDCMSSDLGTVRSIAQSLNIPTLGLNQQQLCEKIFGYHLSRVSELILNRGADIREIANITSPEAQQKALQGLARQLKLQNVKSLDDLLRRWLEAHYTARAISMYPQRQQDVTNYLATGTLPQDEGALRDLGVVFSDIRRDIYNMNPQQRREALNALYNQFVSRLQGGGRQALGTFEANLGRYGFGTFQTGSPNRPYSSPISQYPTGGGTTGGMGTTAEAYDIHNYGHNSGETSVLGPVSDYRGASTQELADFAEQTGLRDRILEVTNAGSGVTGLSSLARPTRNSPRGNIPVGLLPQTPSASGMGANVEEGGSFGSEFEL